MNLPDFLTNSPDGEIRLTGHRIGLYTIMRLHNEGLSAEQIVEELPSLSLAHVAKVLAFCRENQAEVDRYVADYRAELDRQEAAHPPSPALLRIRQLLREREQGNGR
jgi:uncharacterized protein (DUF433 family)